MAPPNPFSLCFFSFSSYSSSFLPLATLVPLLHPQVDLHLLLHSDVHLLFPQPLKLKLTSTDGDPDPLAADFDFHSHSRCGSDWERIPKQKKRKHGKHRHPLHA